MTLPNLFSSYLDWRYGPHIDPDRYEVVKLFPSNPPRKGERILVGKIPHRVTRVRVSWREPGVWTITDLRVREDAL